MDKRSSRATGGKHNQFKRLIMDNDIRMLMMLPAFIGFGGFLVWFFTMEFLGLASQASVEIALGVASLIETLAGVAQIYKQEIPTGFGGILKGKIAIASGIIIVIVFGISGIYLVISGFTKLF